MLQPERITGLPLVEAKDISMRFGETDVIDRVSLSIHEKEIVTLIGPNGSGKTTLARIILGLQAPSAGQVTWRKYTRIGYVPQHFQVDETLPLTVRRLLRLSVSHRKDRSITVLEEAGVAHAIDQPVQSLSGGELRRVLLARALLREPDMLVLDEPTSGVDVAGQAELYDLIKNIRDQHACGVLLVSHNLHLVMAATDHVMCINHHVCCEGHPEAVSQAPEYLALFGAQAAKTLAVYTHEHDHHHDVTGHPVQDHNHDHNHDGASHG
ncbi:MAG: zinc ABC transporter ATP-binding protein ZnuC [Rhodospirillales bacterium]